MGSAPLQGITVVEFGHSVAAPFAGQTLGDLGADVWKVEKPGGDDARKWGPPFVDGVGATFLALNRNKRSLMRDLRDPVQREEMLRFVLDRADIVLQNMRPGQADGLGLGADALTGAKPTLIYCNMGAFGARGPLRDRPGYDPLMQAFGGIMSVTGEEGRPPVRVGPSIIDMGTGMWAVIGILSALHRRGTTGKGGVVDVSLFETAASWMSIHALQAQAANATPRRQGSGQVGIVPYRAFETADGWLVVAAGNDGLFARFCGVIGHAEWAQDARFASNPLRVENQAALHAEIEPIMRGRANADWVAALDAAGVPCAPVQDTFGLLGHEQTSALGLLQAVPGLDHPVIGLPVSFDGIRPDAARAPPALGEHTPLLASGRAR